MNLRRSSRARLMLALIVASLVNLGLYGYGAWRNHSLDYGFFPWNLLLAWLPMLFALRLNHVLGYKRWSSWEGLTWSVLWLIFLPNSFYMISDLVHLQEVYRVDVMYDVAMFTGFIFTGAALGYASLYLLHTHLRRRLQPLAASAWIGATLFVCSVAIYVGRDLRWNSWDLITNPAGLLFDISSRIINPAAYPQMFTTTLSFFILLSVIYGVLWSAASLLKPAADITK